MRTDHATDSPPVATAAAGMDKAHLADLANAIKRKGRALGFQQVGVAGVELGEAESRFRSWLARGFHGEMDYLARHGNKRTRPAELVPGTVRVVSARMDYWPDGSADAEEMLDRSPHAYVSRYALGRDYHKVLRARLKRLAEFIRVQVGGAGYRVFVDSAPVLEKPLAQNAGLGWIGKHTNLLNANAGSWFFLGELFTDIPLPVDKPATDHCGSCSACIDVCPTGAIVAPYVLDARRCISYLTIELRGSIPEEFRRAIGNRVFGCDDCQLVCPWNKFATPSGEADFAARHGLDVALLVDLFRWSEADWDAGTRGSALRRAGYEGWLRNLAVALGNAETSPEVVAALRERIDHPSDVVREHVLWALRQH
ncbi:MAG: tRNA epoxyqueuosine(34) reductase QueG [Rhodospirillaceae bacterium]|nr:tRNA epoxyqueuosine(34) reductase QueG [Rhodospirillaceae bacterium]